MKTPIFISLFWMFIMALSAFADKDTINDFDSLVENDTASVNNDTTDDGVLPEKMFQSEKDTLSKSSSMDTIDGRLLTKKIKSFQTSLSRNISKARVHGYGGGIIIQPMLMGFRIKPVRDLVKNDKRLSTFAFDEINYHSYQPILVNGAWLYGGVGNGIRIGFGGWGGEFYSSSNEKPNDSIMVLKVHTSFGGMMIEKAFLHKNLNIITGGMIGSGSINVTQSYQGNDVFNGAVWQEDLEGDAEAKARQVGMELHAGMTISVLPWWHIGADVNSYFMVSVNGFGGSGNTFATAYPGFRLRVVFGNLG